ncbi:MAG: PilZ domain-containing protein [Bryobacteraceae bacterium]
MLSGHSATPMPYENYAALDPIRITALDGLEKAVPGVVDGLGSGGTLRVTVPTHLAAGMPVRIEAGLQCTASGMVLFSSTQGDKHYATIGISPDERRRDPRIPVNGKAHIVSVNPPLLIDANARVTDVSRSGIGIFTDASVPSGTVLKIVTDGSVIWGQVRHCARLAATGHYKAGIEIETVIFRDEAGPAGAMSARALWGAISSALRKLRGRI